jgi:hypothetical protein
MLYGEYIYIVSRDEESGVSIHRESKKAYEWIAGKEIFYGAIVDGYIYFASANKNIGGIWKRNIDTGESELIFSISDDSEIKLYRYWNIIEYERKVYFLPIEAKEMVVYDIDNRKIEYMDVIGEAIQKKNRIFDLIRYNDRYIVIPFWGEEIWICSTEMKKQNKICYRAEINDFVKCHMEIGCILENEELEISEIMEGWMPDMEDENIVHQNIGNEIHKNVLMELD